MIGKRKAIGRGIAAARASRSRGPRRSRASLMLEAFVASVAVVSASKPKRKAAP